MIDAVVRSNSSHGTRPKILTILKEQGQASVDQLARDLALASTTVRRHLDILQRDRLIAVRQSREGAGRPQNLYFLTEEGLEAQPKGYGQLLVSLLEEISRLTPENLEGLSGNSLSKLLFSRMAEHIIPSTVQYQDTQVRFNVLLELLRDQDFDPELEQMDRSTRIVLHNCPFRLGALFDANVCQFDQTLISKVLDAPVTQEQCILRGDRVCCYLSPLTP